MKFICNSLDRFPFSAILDDRSGFELTLAGLN